MDALTIVALLFFAAAAISWVLMTFVFKTDQKKAVMTAAILAAIGGGILVLNAVINPDSIQIPDVNVTPPVINVP